MINLTGLIDKDKVKITFLLQGIGLDQVLGWSIVRKGNTIDQDSIQPHVT